MKRYADYTKDDLMRLIESLTPGGSEFHEEPETCMRFVKGRYRSYAALLVKRRKAEAERDSLLAVAEKALDLLGELNFSGNIAGRVTNLVDELTAAIAAAKTP